MLKRLEYSFNLGHPSNSVSSEIQALLSFTYIEEEVEMDKASRAGNLVWLGAQWVFLVSPYSFPIYKYPLVQGLSNLLGEGTMRKL